MKAMLATALGSPDVLAMQDLPDPQVGPTDLLIEVHAAAVNPVDCKIRKTAFGGKLQPPLVLGYDVSGVIVDMGNRVDPDCFRVGHEVFASPSLVRPGANAELVAVDARTVAHKPDNVDHLTAAALPLATITAWDALHRRAGTHAGETVFIHAGGGGVGHIAIQLAKLHGCRIITTASREESIALCEKLGADVVIDYQSEDVVARVMQETEGQGCAVVIDTIGGSAFLQALDCVAVHGRLVTILAPPADAPIHKLFVRDVTLSLEFMGAPNMFDTPVKRNHRTILQTVAELVEAGRLMPHISRTYELADLAEAHRQQETGHTLGKLAIRVKE